MEKVVNTDDARTLAGLDSLSTDLGFLLRFGDFGEKLK